MKKIIIGIIVVLVIISLVRTIKVGKPTIYIDIKHDKTQLLESIDHLKNATMLERILALSDSIISKSTRVISNKLSTIRYDYYYITDYCIDHYQKDRMLASMTLNEWYDFKQHRNNWDVLQGASCTLGPYVSQGYRTDELKRIEETVLAK